MILLIDNYDSFVHNLARYIRELGFETQVVRNDEITTHEMTTLNPSHIVISPGPGTPSDAGISLEVIGKFGKSIPILGVCLGHQAIGQFYGGIVTRAKCPMHGKASYITHDGTDIFWGLSKPLKVGRYHSLIVDDKNFPDELVVTARSDQGEIMAIRHRQYPTYGVQFHPESILTLEGYQLLKNFLKVNSRL